MTARSDAELPIILVGAMTQDRVIGKGEGMPWDIPEEYQTFIDNIRGQTVIMGRKSYEIFGPDLTSSHAVVVSRSQPSVDVPIAESIENAIDLAKRFGQKIFVAGGAQIYELALPHADWMFLSEIKQRYDGDTYFPKFDQSEWTIEREDDHEKFIYREWKRIS